MQDVNEVLDRYEQMLQSLNEHSRNVSPMWKRGEHLTNPALVLALADYKANKVLNSKQFT